MASARGFLLSCRSIVPGLSPSLTRPRMGPRSPSNPREGGKLDERARHHPFREQPWHGLSFCSYPIGHIGHLPPPMQGRLGNVAHLPSSRMSLPWEGEWVSGASLSLPQPGTQSPPQPASVRGVAPLHLLDTCAHLTSPASSSEKPSLTTTAWARMKGLRAHRSRGVVGAGPPPPHRPGQASHRIHFWVPYPMPSPKLAGQQGTGNGN